MKIVVQERKIVLFEDLKSGDCFLFKGVPYMKISADFSTCSFNTVHLRCGSVSKLGDKVRVEPLECELHY